MRKCIGILSLLLLSCGTVVQEAQELMVEKKKVEWNPGWTDKISNWRIYYSPTMFDPSNPEGIRLGLLQLNRRIALKVDDRGKYRWVPDGEFDVYPIEDLELVKQLSRRIVNASDGIPPHIGGRYYITGKYIFLGTNIENDYCGVCGIDTFDFCKPIFDSINSYVYKNPDHNLETVFRHFMTIAPDEYRMRLDSGRQ